MVAEVDVVGRRSPSFDGKQVVVGDERRARTLEVDLACVLAERRFRNEYAVARGERRRHREPDRGKSTRRRYDRLRPHVDRRGSRDVRRGRVAERRVVVVGIPRRVVESPLVDLANARRSTRIDVRRELQEVALARAAVGTRSASSTASGRTRSHLRGRGPLRRHDRTPPGRARGPP